MPNCCTTPFAWHRKNQVGEEGFAGFFPLPDSIAPGHYTLRFYTLRSASLPIPRFHYTPITVSAHRRMQPRLATNKNTDAFHVSFFPEADTCRQAL